LANLPLFLLPLFVVDNLLGRGVRLDLLFLRSILLLLLLGLLLGLIGVCRLFAVFRLVGILRRVRLFCLVWILGLIRVLLRLRLILLLLLWLVRVLLLLLLRCLLIWSRISLMVNRATSILRAAFSFFGSISSTCRQ